MATDITNPHTLDGMSRALTGLRSEMLDAETLPFGGLADLPEESQGSARNLLHYLALRRHDLRGLQRKLESLGLSTLEGAESRALENVEAVLGILRHLDVAAPRYSRASNTGRGLLDAHTETLFGAARAGRAVRIMVTMPAEAAHEYALVRDLVRAGMDCMRINCAHDEPETWDRMLHHLRRAADDTGQPCRAVMDLAGPKLRTAAVEPGPHVIRCRPKRDVFGRVIAPARVWLTSREQPRPSPQPAAATIPVGGAWIAQLIDGDRVTLIDAREADRTLTVTAVCDGGAWAEASQTTYVVPGTPLIRRRRCAGEHRRTHVEDVPATTQSIALSAGDVLILTKDTAPGRPAVRHEDGTVLSPARIGITLPTALADVRPGESVWFDDGRIGGVIRNVFPSHVEVAITHANTTGLTLGGDKGINLPDSTLHLPPLTDKDLEDLRFIATHADIVGYSFVRTAEDVRALQRQLHALDRPGLPLILKIETRRAFEHLPSLLIAVMHSAAAGVMIARGDLAVECGFERLAEVQEEILWMAEASHTPVIWATQVLETLAKEGIPSRAEITDAAMAERAECVMLNKGPYILDATRALSTILTRMQAHQRKTRVMLCQSGIASRFFGGSAG
jgi:pyruvate kinase